MGFVENYDLRVVKGKNPPKLMNLSLNKLTFILYGKTCALDFKTMPKTDSRLYSRQHKTVRN